MGYLNNNLPGDANQGNQEWQWQKPQHPSTINLQPTYFFVSPSHPFLVGGLEHFFFHILGIIIPTD